MSLDMFIILKELAVDNLFWRFGLEDESHLRTSSRRNRFRRIGVLKDDWESGGGVGACHILQFLFQLESCN